VSGTPPARRALPEEMDAVMALRRAVFCEEQGVPEELERDAEDATAVHVVALDEGGRDIAVDDALDHVFGYAIGLDMTRRDMQAVAKKAGRPWDMAKGFDESAPTGTIRAAEEIGHPVQGAIWLRINGDLRQEGDLDQQIWKVPETISYLSTLVALRAGDLIMTGTPKGVGPVEPGDRLEGHIDGVGDLTVVYEG